MKEIAICISGQFRTFDKIWKENLKILSASKEYNYHFFCFFWKTRGDTQRILPGNNRTFKNLFQIPFIITHQKIVKKLIIKK